MKNRAPDYISRPGRRDVSAALLLLLSACLVRTSPSDGDAEATLALCEAVDCGVHGACGIVTGQPTCVCDLGYTAAGLTCVEEGTGDGVPPQRTNETPTGTLPGGTVEVVVAVRTDVRAYCRYDEKPGTDYVSMPGALPTADGFLHQRPVTNLSPGDSHLFAVRCQDLEGDTNPDDLVIEFDIDQYADCKSPELPACDVEVAPLWLDSDASGFGNSNGTDEFAELQALLEATTDGDADGWATVCLNDGIHIVTTNAASGDALSIPADDMALIALPGHTATLINMRNDATMVGDSGIYIIARRNVLIANLNLQVTGDEGRTVYTSGATSRVVLDGLTIDASGYHSEGVHARGAVERIINTTILTHGNRGYGIEGQNTGDIGTIGCVKINTEGADAHGIGNFVNDGAAIGLVVQTRITTAGSNAHGIILDANSAINAMWGVSLRRSVNSVTAASAISVGVDGFNYFVTADVFDNIVCSEAGGVPWANLLDDDGTAYTDPTVPFVSAATTIGAKTFPWGDADDVNSDGIDNWNLQTQWGGPCP